MKRVKVEIPFHMNATGKDHVPGDVIDVDIETLDRIRAVNVNMVSVLSDVDHSELPDAEQPKKKKASKVGKE